MPSALADEFQTLMRMGPMAEVANPYPLFRRMRDADPVARLDRPGAPMYAVMRNADASRVLRDPDTFGSGVNARSTGLVLGPTIIQMDGPEHILHRRLITPAMAPGALRGDFPGLVEKLAHEIIDPFAAVGEADLVPDFTFLFPLRVFVEILGLPAADIENFHRLAVDLTLIAKDPGRAMAASAAMAEALEPEIARKRAAPENDLLSSLAVAEVDGQRLSDEEVVSFLRLLVIAGAETTYHLLGSALHVLLERPDLLAELRADPARIDPFLQETLRYESPISTLMREVRHDTEIGGVPVAAGSDLVVHVGSANRDEARYAEPDAFEIDRDNRDHLAFGLGTHFCAGSRLALLEARVGLRVLLERLAGLEVAPDRRSRVIGFAFRGPDTLPVRFDRG